MRLCYGTNVITSTRCQMSNINQMTDGVPFHPMLSYNLFSAHSFGDAENVEMEHFENNGHLELHIVYFYLISIKLTYFVTCFFIVSYNMYIYL